LFIAYLAHKISYKTCQGKHVEKDKKI